MKFTDIVRDHYRGPAYGQEFTTWYTKVRHGFSTAQVDQIEVINRQGHKRNKARGRVTAFELENADQSAVDVQQRLRYEMDQNTCASRVGVCVSFLHFVTHF